MLSALLDETITDEAVRRTIFQRVSATSLRTLLDETAQLIRPSLTTMLITLRTVTATCAALSRNFSSD